MNILISIKDFDLGLRGNDFFVGADIADENFDDDIDQRIDTLLNAYSDKHIQSFTIPISLSNNFMEFGGLIFANHIRLSRNLTFFDAPIIFYGALDIEQILRLTPLARILLTNNIQYVNIVKYTFEDIQKSLERYEKKSFDLVRFLEQVQINPPSNYDSHHGTDNEFALIQWSKYIKCLNSLPQRFRKEFDSRLYFKYLRAKFAFPDVNDSYPVTISTNEHTKILLIDDEANKGWKNFYEAFFNNSNIDFVDSGIEFKNGEIDDLYVKVISKVKEFKPHIVLLDLRLLDSDFGEEVKPVDLTGINILERIKEFNKGIQVIIISASNKAWNFNLAKQKGAYDFIIKDGTENPKASLGRLVSSIEIASKRASFLKEIQKRIDVLSNYIDQNSHLDDIESADFEERAENHNKLRKKIKTNIISAFELLDIGCEDSNKSSYYSYFYLQLFLCIEIYVKLESVIEIGDQYFVVHSKKRICVAKRNDEMLEQAITFKNGNGKYVIEKCVIRNKRPDTNFLVSSLLIFEFGNESSSVRNWTKVYTTRNKVAHEGYVPNEDQIYDLLEFMHYFFDERNEKDDNIEKGLTPVSLEESLQKLQQKFNQR